MPRSIVLQYGGFDMYFRWQERFLVALAAALFLFGAARVSAQNVTVPLALVTYPDLIIYNAKIVTMDDPSLNSTTGKIVQAMAVRQGRILALGSDAEILALAGPQTSKTDLKGRTVIPGIINTHSHMHDHSIQEWTQKNADKIESVVRSFSVTGKTYEELAKGIELVIKEQMAHPLPDQWAVINLPRGGSAGTGIGVQYLNDPEKGAKQEDLNRLAPTTPVMLNAHPNWMLNKAAEDSILGLYGLENTPESREVFVPVFNTTISRSLVVDRYFAPRVPELAEIIRGGLEYQAATGFTTFSSHIVGLRIFDAYRLLDRQGRMPIRFAFAHRYGQQVEPDPAGFFLRLGDLAGLGTDYFWNVGPTMGGLDSGPPSICTTMDAPPRFKEKEKCVLEGGSNTEDAIATALSSYQRYVANHVYGDKAFDNLLNIIDRVIETNPGITLAYIQSRRLTADHCGFYPRKEQLERIKRFNMIISCDPMFLDRSYPWLKVYGMDKANRIGPMKSMLKAGIMVTAESEMEVESGKGPTYFAVQSKFLTRRNSRGDLVAPEEALDRVELMKAMTTWASYYVIRQDQIGSLEPGKLADFVVLNKDYFTIPEKEIPTVFPLMTVLGGKTIVLRRELAAELGVPPVGPQIEWEFSTPWEEQEIQM
ncbi:MAG TPA: amidohydrolase family protein [Terriglobia bacterium]|nr:amidohydrolase family protein [Terriglobia bacterium]